MNICLRYFRVRCSWRRTSISKLTYIYKENDTKEQDTKEQHTSELENPKIEMIELIKEWYKWKKSFSEIKYKLEKIAN